MKSNGARITNWLLLNITFTSLLYLAFAREIAWAENLVLFIAWIFILGSLSMANKQVAKDTAARGYTIGKVSERIIDLIYITIFVGTGHIITAIGMVVYFIIIHGTHETGGKA